MPLPPARSMPFMTGPCVRLNDVVYASEFQAGKVHDAAQFRSAVCFCAEGFVYR